METLALLEVVARVRGGKGNNNGGKGGDGGLGFGGAGLQHPYGSGGGGGGYYGGGGGAAGFAGGGGSGYIDGVSDGVTEANQNSGDGKARITLIE